MISFDDLKKKPGPGIEIAGGFACHECGKYVSTALLNKKSGILSWICPNGHKSEIEWNL